MTFDELRAELRELQGTAVLLQVRPAGEKTNVFSMIDRVDRAGHWDDERDRFYVTFWTVESSLGFDRARFVEAAWEGGWGRGEEEERLLRMRLGSVEVGLQVL